MLLASSLLGAYHLELKKAVKSVEKHIDYIHIDVMDGVFVPNFAFGTQIISEVSKLTNKPVEAHLMINEPRKHISHFTHADIITVHAEATVQLKATLLKIKQQQCKVGVALNPKTSLSVLDEVWSLLDYVLIMGVQPGFGNQTFIFSVLSKIKKARIHIDKHKLPIQLAVDGGVNLAVAKKIRKAGADVAVVGSYLFSS